MSDVSTTTTEEVEFTFRKDSLWEYVLAVPTWLGAITLFILMSMTFLDVILRSLFNDPIQSATELTRMFMAIIVFSALPLVSWKSQNIVVDLFDPMFSTKMARWRDILIELACGIMLIWPAKRVWELAERARGYGDVTEYLNLPQHYIAWFIAVFTGFTALAFIARAVTRMMPSQRSN